MLGIFVAFFTEDVNTRKVTTSSIVEKKNNKIELTNCYEQKIYFLEACFYF